MMPSPLCFQTLSWRFSVSRLVAIWGFTFLGHVFCGIFQLKGVFLSLEKLTLRSSINRRRWPKMVMLEKVMLWVGIHDIASCEVMQPEGAPSGILLFLFIKMLGMKALLWSKVQQQVVGHPHQDEQRVLLDFQALRQIRLPSAYSKGTQSALVVENPPEVLKGKMRFGIRLAWKNCVLDKQEWVEHLSIFVLVTSFRRRGYISAVKVWQGTLHAVEVCHQLNILFPKALKWRVAKQISRLQRMNKMGFDKKRVS